MAILQNNTMDMAHWAKEKRLISVTGNRLLCDPLAIAKMS
jgi:hypothetical protein